MQTAYRLHNMSTNAAALAAQHFIGTPAYAKSGILSILSVLLAKLEAFLKFWPPHPWSKHLQTFVGKHLQAHDHSRRLYKLICLAESCIL